MSKVTWWYISNAVSSLIYCSFINREIYCIVSKLIASRKYFVFWPSFPAMWGKVWNSLMLFNTKYLCINRWANIIRCMVLKTIHFLRASLSKFWWICKKYFSEETDSVFKSSLQTFLTNPSRRRIYVKLCKIPTWSQQRW
jgi:hypothetical protein